MGGRLTMLQQEQLWILIQNSSTLLEISLFKQWVIFGWMQIMSSAFMPQVSFPGMIFCYLSKLVCFFVINLSILQEYLCIFGLAVHVDFLSWHVWYMLSDTWRYCLSGLIYIKFTKVLGCFLFDLGHWISFLSII